MSPKESLGIAKSSSRSSSRHSWVHGGSPRSCRSGNSSSKAKTTKSSGASTTSSANCCQFLTLPQPVQQDPYTTPKHKEVYLADSSNTERSERLNKALQAPKKRDEMYGEQSARNLRAQEYENVSIRAFRLDASSCKSNPGVSESGENSLSAAQQQERKQAMEDLRGQWQAFTQNIMSVEIAPTQGSNLRM